MYVTARVSAELASVTRSSAERAITAQAGTAQARTAQAGTARAGTIRPSKASRLRQQVSSQRRFPDRALHVVDIENLAGAPIPSLGQVIVVQDWYLKRLGLLGAADHVVMAASHYGLLNAALGWPHVRYRVRSGPDGADIELLDVLLNEDVATRFRHVVIGSGDGFFTEAAAGLRDLGVRVTVVSRRGSLAASLARVVHGDVVYLDLPA